MPRSMVCRDILVDDENYDLLKTFNWTIRSPKPGNYRIITKLNGKEITIANMVMQTENIMYDHIDRNQFNNQKKNLRIVTYKQNAWNSNMLVNNTSGYKGVCWNKRDKVWQAAIKTDGKIKYLGSFKDPIKAAKAYDKAAKEYHGEYGFLNFPENK